MKVEKRYCDRCNVELNNKNHAIKLPNFFLTLLFGSIEEYENKDLIRKHYDICKSCITDFKKWYAIQ